jgi:hypothetical protein
MTVSPLARTRAIALALAVATAAPAAAMVVEGATVAELAAATDLVVRGVVVATRAVRHEGRVATVTTVDVIDAYGDAAPATVRVWTWSVGEEVIVFLDATSDGWFVSHGGAYTKFSVDADGDAAVRSLAGVTVSDPDDVVGDAAAHEESSELEAPRLSVLSIEAAVRAARGVSP